MNSPKPKNPTELEQALKNQEYRLASALGCEELTFKPYGIYDKGYGQTWIVSGNTTKGETQIHFDNWLFTRSPTVVFEREEGNQRTNKFYESNDLMKLIWNMSKKLFEYLKDNYGTKKIYFVDDTSKKLSSKNLSEFQWDNPKSWYMIGSIQQTFRHRNQHEFKIISEPENHLYYTPEWKDFIYLPKESKKVDLDLSNLPTALEAILKRYDSLVNSVFVRESQLPETTYCDQFTCLIHYHCNSSLLPLQELQKELYNRIDKACPGFWNLAIKVVYCYLSNCRGDETSHLFKRLTKFRMPKTKLLE